MSGNEKIVCQGIAGQARNDSLSVRGLRVKPAMTGFGDNFNIMINKFL